MSSEKTPEYTSAVIQALMESGADKDTIPTTLCIHCPSAMWWMDRQGPHCFCRQNHLMTWTASQKPSITHCDGYNVAMMEYREGQEPQAMPEEIIRDNMAEDDLPPGLMDDDEL